MNSNDKDKRDFINFEDIRESGKYNMVTDADIIASKIDVSMDRYIWIIENYSKLNELYRNGDVK